MSDDEKRTAEFEAPPKWAQDMFGRVHEGIAAVRADVGLVANDVTLVKDRVTLVEKRVGDLEVAKVRHSDGARELSNNDLAHEAALAQAKAELAEERKAREALTAIVASQPTKADLDEALKAQNSTLAAMLAGAAKTPMGQKILGAVGMVILAALGLVYAKLQAQQQPAPVYIQAPADGGAK